MKRTGKQEAGTLVYPQHRLTPEDLLNFCEMSGFVQDWEQLHLDVESDLLALQVSIMANPRCGTVVPGTGGLRKLEFAPPKGLGGQKRGKRNACRVCYAYFEEFYTVFLITAYAKGRKDDIEEDEKKAIKKVLHRIHCNLSTRYPRTR